VAQIYYFVFGESRSWRSIRYILYVVFHCMHIFIIIIIIIMTNAFCCVNFEVGDILVNLILVNICSILWRYISLKHTLTSQLYNLCFMFSYFWMYVRPAFSIFSRKWCLYKICNKNHLLTYILFWDIYNKRFYLVKPTNFPKTCTLLILYFLPCYLKHRYHCVTECSLCTALCPTFS
jgi:hypothetical protein